MTALNGVPTRGPATFAEAELGLPPGSFPFASHWLQCGAARLHYVDEGSGPVLLMLHGNPTWSFMYRHMIRALSPHFRCIAIDFPGFGLSAAPAGFGYLPEEHAALVGEAIRRLDLVDATLVAHDWGGPIGLAAAFSQPGRVTRFVLGNTWAWPVNGDWHFEWFSRLMGGPLGRWGARRANLFVNGVLRSAMRRGPLPASVLAAYRAPFKRTGDVAGTHVFPRCITASRSFLGALAERIPQLAGDRVLFVWPDEDIAFRTTELQRWLELLPGAAVQHVRHCGHYVWEEAAPEAAAAILAWHPARDAGKAAPEPLPVRSARG